MRHGSSPLEEIVMTNDIRVQRLEQERRYVLLLEGEHAGELVFRDRGGSVLAFLHTEVDPGRQRRGLGSALVRGALDDVRERGLKVVAVCPFVEAFIDEHSEYADLAVADPARRG
jgi:predicted GNAT family acetyltransferase